VDLKQVKTFFGADPTKYPRVLYDGTELVGTDEAVREEMLALWDKLRNGGLREELAGGMRKLKQVCEASRVKGRSRAEMEGLSRYFRV
jgi:hypothetical protein